MIKKIAVLLALVFLLLFLLITIPLAIIMIRKLGKYLDGEKWWNPAMAFLIGFFIFLIGDFISAVVIGNSALDIQLHDTYFVIKNPHLLSIFAVIFLGFYTLYWGFPRVTGKTLNAPLSYLHFTITLIGAFALAWPMHYEGLAGMPRRYIDYSNWTTLNRFGGINTFQANVVALLVLAQLLFVINLFYTALKRKK